MGAVALAVGFDGYCLFGVDPLTQLRSVMFSRHGLEVSTDRLIHNETVEHDVNRYEDLIGRPVKAGTLSCGPKAPSSPRLHEILRPEGYSSELRLVLVMDGRYWGALSLFRDDTRRPFTDELADVANALSEPLSLAIRRYQVSRIGSPIRSRAAGVVLFDGPGRIVDVSDDAHAWLTSLADSWADGAQASDVIRVVHEVAAVAAGRRPGRPLCRVRMPTGEWLLVSGSKVAAGDVDVVVVLRPGDIDSVAPAFAAWCGLTPREAEVLTVLTTGLSAKQMARRLSISVLTLNDHLRSIYRKAGVRGRDELFSQLC